MGKETGTEGREEGSEEGREGVRRGEVQSMQQGEEMDRGGDASPCHYINEESKLW